jgi:hypothetical protein
VLKLQRVGSAQNAALEMKHEIAAVRLLQFGLTVAKPGASSGISLFCSRREQVERYQKKLQVEDNQDTVDEGKVDIYWREVARLYADLNKLV